MPDPTALTRLRKVAGVIFAISVAVGLVVLWIPNEKLQDQSPIQTLLSPKTYTTLKAVEVGPRWRPSFTCKQTDNLPDEQPVNPKIGDCYQGSLSGDFFEFKTDFDVVERRLQVSRITALGVVGRSILAAAALVLIVLLCIALVFGSYRLVAGKQQRK